MKLKLGSSLYLFLSIALIHPIAAQEIEPIINSKPNVTVFKFVALLKEAKEGDPKAQYDLLVINAKGEGVPMDSAKVAASYQEAAEQGNAMAQFVLGLMYVNGIGINKNPTKAVEWFQKAADQGNARAQLMLAGMYAKGEDVPLDFTKSAEWIQKAAEQRNAEAQYLLAVIYANGETFPENLDKATGLFQKAAEQGNVRAQIILGGLFWSGSIKGGIPKDTAKALEWYEKAVQHSDATDTPHIQMSIGTIYYQGEGIPKNLTKALEWIKKAAENGDSNAQGMLGILFSVGQEVPKDEIKAASWTRKAAAQGNALAQTDFGGMYMNGQGVNKDYVRAYAWLDLAAGQGNKYAQRNRDKLEHSITVEQRTEGQRLASNWKKGDTLDGNTTESLPNSGSLTKVFTGTAFIISRDGHAITNDHVIHNCAEVKIAGHDGVAKVVTSDNVNDLALLQLSGKVNAVASLNPNIGKLRQGEDILVFGYPLGSLLSSGGNLTPGMISAMTGLGNNSNQIQITAPIQPGSSGSPVIDKKGNVIAVVSMKLDDAIIASFTGSIPQNVNFAINDQTLKTFLEANKVPYKTGSKSAQEKHNADIAEEASKWTVLVECWK